MLKITIQKHTENLFTVRVFVDARLVLMRQVETREPYEITERIETMLKCNNDTLPITK